MLHELDVPILHVDMDAFFVEVERLRRPDLRRKPVMVGGTGPRAVVASASYEARAKGVTSAMPMAAARRRCPDGVVVSPDHREYRRISELVFAVFDEFTPVVEPLSVDEAFLDIRGLRLHYGDAHAVAADLRGRIRERLGLPASVGGATTKFLAKLASEDAKPDGILIVPPGAEAAFLHPMDVRRLWGVGEATLAGLEALGIHTVADLAATPLDSLQRRLGRSLGEHLKRLANGEDGRPVDRGSGARSISVEETFDVDLHADTDIDRSLFALCHRLALRLEHAGSSGHTLTLKVRLGDFTTITRSATFQDPIARDSDLRREARMLLGRADRQGLGIRLLGIGVAGLVAIQSARQLQLDGSDHEQLDAATRRVRDRYGDGAVIPARLAERPAGKVKRPPAEAEESL